MKQDRISTHLAGLCISCKHVRIVRSDRDSVFYQCKLAATDPRFPQYPSLPVLTCEGYEEEVIRSSANVSKED
ncbi:MAG TPA: hypothetical protein VGV68_00300 [Terriglobia bacterium]|nr:hypothetical protein [Terriglobia bacterium]